MSSQLTELAKHCEHYLRAEDYANYNNNIEIFNQLGGDALKFPSFWKQACRFALYGIISKLEDPKYPNQSYEEFYMKYNELNNLFYHDGSNRDNDNIICDKLCLVKEILDNAFLCSVMFETLKSKSVTAFDEHSFDVAPFKGSDHSEYTDNIQALAEQFSIEIQVADKFQKIVSGNKYDKSKIAKLIRENGITTVRMPLLQIVDEIRLLLPDPLSKPMLMHHQPKSNIVSMGMNLNKKKIHEQMLTQNADWTEDDINNISMGDNSAVLYNLNRKDNKNMLVGPRSSAQILSPVHASMEHESLILRGAQRLDHVSQGIMANRGQFAPTIQGNISRHLVRDDEAALIDDQGAPVLNHAQKAPKRKKNNQYVEKVLNARLEELGEGRKRKAWTDYEVNALLAGIRKHYDKARRMGQPHDAKNANLWSEIKKDPDFEHELRLRTNVMCKDKFRTLYSQNPGLFPDDMIPPADRSQRNNIINQQVTHAHDIDIGNNNNNSDTDEEDDQLAKKRRGQR